MVPVGLVYIIGIRTLDNCILLCYFHRNKQHAIAHSLLIVVDADCISTIGGHRKVYSLTEIGLQGGHITGLHCMGGVNSKWQEV
jgi:hypothetical protein